MAVAQPTDKEKVVDLTDITVVYSAISENAMDNTNNVKSEKPYNLALKANLLFLLAGGIDVGAEMYVGKNISAAINLAYAYTRINNNYTLQTKQVGIEARYWFNQKENRWTGWNAGIYGTYCDRFDVQWKDGYQGDGFWSAGISAGYAIPITPKFNIDLSIAGGYIYLPELRHYHEPVDGKLLWQETRYNVGTFALTRVNVSLIWLFSITKKRTKCSACSLPY